MRAEWIIIAASVVFTLIIMGWLRVIHQNWSELLSQKIPSSEADHVE